MPHPKAVVGKSVAFNGVSYSITKSIGEGGFAEIFLARSEKDKKLHALKRMFIARDDEEKHRAAKWEYQLNQKCIKHTNIVACEGAQILTHSNGDLEYLILLEYCERGTLLEWINSAQHAQHTEKEVLSIFRQVCDAVACLHAHQPPIRHQDLKPENILLHESGVWKLCDMGSSMTENFTPSSSADRVTVGNMIAACTTPSYRSPEMCDLYAGKSITHASDLWALGVMLYTMLFREQPFGGTLATLSGKYFLPDSYKWSAKLIDVMAKCLITDPAKRITIVQLQTALAEMTGTQPNVVKPWSMFGAVVNAPTTPGATIATKPTAASSSSSSSTGAPSSSLSPPATTTLRPPTTPTPTSTKSPTSTSAKPGVSPSLTPTSTTTKVLSPSPSPLSASSSASVSPPPVTLPTGAPPPIPPRPPKSLSAVATSSTASMAAAGAATPSTPAVPTTPAVPPSTPAATPSTPAPTTPAVRATALAVPTTPSTPAPTQSLVANNHSTSPSPPQPSPVITVVSSTPVSVEWGSDDDFNPVFPDPFASSPMPVVDPFAATTAGNDDADPFASPLPSANSTTASHSHSSATYATLSPGGEEAAEEDEQEDNPYPTIYPDLTRTHSTPPPHTPTPPLPPPPVPQMHALSGHIKIKLPSSQSFPAASAASHPPQQQQARPKMVLKIPPPPASHKLTRSPSSSPAPPPSHPYPSP